jgi:hypothetical protein
MELCIGLVLELRKEILEEWRIIYLPSYVSQFILAHIIMMIKLRNLRYADSCNMTGNDEKCAVL